MAAENLSALWCSYLMRPLVCHDSLDYRDSANAGSISSMRKLLVTVVVAVAVVAAE